MTGRRLLGVAGVGVVALGLAGLLFFGYVLLVHKLLSVVIESVGGNPSWHVTWSVLGLVVLLLGPFAWSRNPWVKAP